MPSVARAGVDTGGGLIDGSGISTVLVNGSPISVVGDSVADHGSGIHNPPNAIVDGSSTVFAGGIAVTIIGSNVDCGHTVTTGSSNVNAGA